MENYSISIIGREDGGLTGKGPFGSSLSAHKLPIETLRLNLLDFINKIETTLEGVNLKIKNYELDEIEMSLEVSASGRISLLGSVGADASGGITLKFKRCTHE